VASKTADSENDKENRFWEDHTKWSESVLQSPLDIIVDAPEVVSGFKSYILYNVSSNPMGYCVQRRYSDFFWLRQTLARRYVGVLVPTLPEKGSWTFKGPKFIQLRMRSLSIFMDKLIDNAYLRSDVAFLDFLSIKARKEFDQAKKKNPIDTYTSSLVSSFNGMSVDGENVGEIKWREALDKYTMPQNTERTIGRIKLQIESLEKVMQNVIKASARLVEKSELYGREMGEFKVALASMILTEETAVNDSESVLKKHWESLGAVLAKIGRVFDRWHFVLKLEPIVNELLFHEVLRYELAQLRALAQLLKQRDNMIEAHQKAVKNARKKELEQQSLVTRGKEDKAKKMNDTIHGLQVNVERCNYVVEFMTKGLFFSELDRFNTCKVAALNEMMAIFSAAQLSYCTKLRSIWQLSADEIGSNPAASHEKAHVILERLGALEGMEKIADQ
jgi:hypothetical protein